VPEVTAYDRVDAAFGHREAGRVPLWATIQNRPLYEHVLGPSRVGRIHEVSLDDKIQLHAEVYRVLGIDMSRAHIWPPDPGAVVDGVSTAPKRHTTAARIAGYTPPLPSDTERDQIVQTYLRVLRADRPATVFAPTIRGCFCPVYERMGLEEFSYACADSPEQVERVMDVHAAYARSMAERWAKHADEVKYVAICDDMAYKGGLIASPAWMRRMWKPRFAGVLEPLLKAGIRVIFHSDGDITEIIPTLIEMGISAINPLEVAAGMDLQQVKRQFGKDLTLIGGVDCSQLLPRGTPAEIRDQVRKVLDIGSAGGGFIIADTSQITPDTPVENVLAFYQTVHEHP
jgi:uroporphyrinogen decarboxylase